MKPRNIFAVHPAGVLVEFALDEGEHLADAVELLVEREYRPSHGDAWPRTPEGVPICPKHAEVMSQREKQGDTWYSHKVFGEHGEVLYCRGYPGKSSPGYQVPVRRAGGDEAQRQRPQAQPQQMQAQPQQAQQARRQEPRPSGPPPPDEAGWSPPVTTAVARPGHVPAAEGMALPDYRRLAREATAANEFDYAAYMVLRNGVYDSVERVAKTRQSLVPEWQASPATNEAALLALEVYRDKRAAAEANGEVPATAHQTAKQQAVKAYKTLLQE